MSTETQEQPGTKAGSGEASVLFSDLLCVGARIRFKRELSSGPSEESPGCLFAYKDEEGEVVRVGGCWEGFMVKRDAWPSPFGCERKDFELLNT